MQRGTHLATLFRQFLVCSWVFETTQTDKMVKFFGKTDLELFPFDPCWVNWNEYYPYFDYGLREFILKEENTPHPEDPSSKDLLDVMDPICFNVNSLVD